MLIFEKDLPKRFNCFKLFDKFCKMSRAIINEYYIYELFAGDNKIVLYSIENPLTNIANCPCGLIYKVEKKGNELNIYIMFIATEYKYRKTGYASIFINEFIDYIKTKYVGKFQELELAIILDSIETAVTFYEHFGFKWTTTEKKYNEVFHVDETNENEHFIMVYKV